MSSSVDGVTTYHAHAVRPGAPADMGAPGVIVLATDPGNSGPDGGSVVAELDVLDGDDLDDALARGGWSAVPGTVTEASPGYYVARVEPADWSEIIATATAALRVAQVRTDRATAGWRRVVADAVRDRRHAPPVERVAELAGIGRARAYQLADEVPDTDSPRASHTDHRNP